MFITDQTLMINQYQSSAKEGGILKEGVSKLRIIL